MEDKKYWTVGEIDATGVRGPHEVELQSISRIRHSSFIELPMEKLEKIVKEDLGGIIENLGFSEDWTITLSMFPEVNIHLIYTFIGDEFGGDVQAEFKFLFSGKRAYWVPGEDSATFIDIVLDFLDRKLKNIEPFEKDYDKKSDLMRKVLLQRSEPFKFLKESDSKELAKFIGGRVWKMTSGWRIKREIFPSIFAEILWDENTGLDIKFSGEKLRTNISSYHAELIGIFTLNHILRYITYKNEDKNLPEICYMMFSRYYTKSKGWEHRTFSSFSNL